MTRNRIALLAMAVGSLAWFGLSGCATPPGPIDAECRATAAWMDWNARSQWLQMEFDQMARESSAEFRDDNFADHAAIYQKWHARWRDWERRCNKHEVNRPKRQQ